MHSIKIIGLDVDGVLNASFTKERLDGYIFVSPCKLELLKQLIDRTGANVLLTSTWRHGWVDLEKGLNTRDAKHFVALRDKLLEFGIELLDHTPITNGSMNHRGEEIDMWLKSWKGEPIESLVLLDDLNGAYLRPYSNRLVRTSFTKGLLQKHVDMAVKILEKPFEYKNAEVLAASAEMVHYSWISDGDVELCEKIEDELFEDTVCYHCDRKMTVGEPAVFLLSFDDGTEYTICPECAKKSCSPA